MRISYLATMITMATLALSGCSSDTTTPQAAAFELDGSWIYLGPSDVPHDLKIGSGSASFTDVAGSWASNWTVKSYDNELNHFQLVFVSGSGSYLPVGQSKSAAYDLSGSLLTIQLAEGLASYPPLQGAGSCTSATDGTPLPDCKLYIKHN
jgi:hypothetical protein